MRAWGLRDALPCRLVTVSAKEAISKKKKACGHGLTVEEEVAVRLLLAFRMMKRFALCASNLCPTRLQNRQETWPAYQSLFVCICKKAVQAHGHGAGDTFGPARPGTTANMLLSSYDVNLCRNFAVQPAL